MEPPATLASIDIVRLQLLLKSELGLGARVVDLGLASVVEADLDSLVARGEDDLFDGGRVALVLGDGSLYVSDDLLPTRAHGVQQQADEQHTEDDRDDEAGAIHRALCTKTHGDTSRFPVPRSLTNA